MKINNILNEDILEENHEIAENAIAVFEELNAMFDDLQNLRELYYNNKEFDNYSKKELNTIIDEMSEVVDDDLHSIYEAVDRQFRRYGDKFVRQYRCTSGDKKGRMVSSPEQCGKRKDPVRVRLGKRAARSKKGIRTRKSMFTKRKTASKRLSRLNKTLRGDE